MAYKQTPASEWRKMDNAELLEAFDIVCTTVCNAHNHSKRGPSKAMLADYEDCKKEILSRMKEGA